MENQEWSALRIDKGRVKQGTALNYTFEYKGTKKITNASGHCSCTVATVSGNNVLVKLNTELSHHLEEQPYNKGLTVFFSDGTNQELRVLATVTK